MAIVAYILAGGKSSRFGSDKARINIESQPLIQKVAKQVTAVAERVTVVAQRSDTYGDLGLRTIGDLQPGRGPCGGLLTAFFDAEQHAAKNVSYEWMLITSCDLLLAPHWFSLLLDRDINTRYDAVAFYDDCWQPFPCLLRRRLALQIQQLVSQSHYAFWRLLNLVNTKKVPVPTGWEERFHINTQGDLHNIKLSE